MYSLDEGQQLAQKSQNQEMLFAIFSINFIIYRLKMKNSFLMNIVWGGGEILPIIVHPIRVEPSVQILKN